MDKEKLSKQYQSLSRTIHHLLKDFQKNREWADIGNWLHRFHQALNQKKFAQLPHQITIAKRLAQCLNPNLPAGVHSHALKVYTLILTNFSNAKNILPLMSIGLFPFFEYSSSQLKTQLIKIFQQHFLSNSQSLQMVISLLNALLTGLNQNNEELSKKIYNLCDSISNKYGKIWVDGAVWVNILKSPKVRLPGFKYLMKVFKDRDKQKMSGSMEFATETEQKQFKNVQKKQQIDIQAIQPISQQKQIINKQQGIKQEPLHNFYQVPQKILQNLRQQEKKFLNKLFQQKNIPDGPHNRFPNFSLLVINALCNCLGNDSESLVKRASLDLVVTHLKISYKNILQKGDAIILVECMLKTIKLKEYSLTRRIYTYLFDQPNSEGQYIINESTRQYQIQILIEALKNLLNQKIDTQKAKVITQAEEILLILDTLMTDHPKLKQILIPRLAYDILSFMKVKAFSTSVIYKALRKKIYEFNDNILAPNKRMFIRSILKIISISSKPQEQLIQGMQLLDFYLHTLLKIRYQSKGSSSNRKNSSQLSHKSEEDKSSEMGQQMKQLYIGIIDKTLIFLKQSKFQYARLSVQILQLSNKLLKELKQSNCELSKNIVINIDELIDMKPSKALFARLLTLHPFPKKQIILPHINEGAFSIVCITNLLFDNQSIELTKDEQVEVFYAIFKLLNCHLWEDKAIQFILQFQTKYQETFKAQIQKVQPSEWLIYWRKRNGDVAGGVIRMIKNVNNSNPLTKHLSCKWIEDSNDIISKIIDPIFKFIKDLKEGVSKQQKPCEIHMDSEGIFQTYDLIEIIFQTSKQSFARFFFLQKNKYLSPFLQFVFKNLQHNSHKIRSKSIQMMKFVLGHTSSYQQKRDFINSTIEVSLYSLNQIIIKKNVLFEMQNSAQILQNEKLGEQNRPTQKQTEKLQEPLSYLHQIQILQYLMTVNINLRKSFKDPTLKKIGIIQMFQQKGLFNVIVKGMSESQLPYIRTLYLDYLRDFCDILSKIQNSNTILNSLINMVLQKLFIMLKKHDVTNLQQIIQGRQQSNIKATVTRTRRFSFDEIDEQQTSNLPFNKSIASIYQQNYQISKNDLNLQGKYAQIIEMWNSIKFFINFSINQSIQSLPIVNLLSLILQSFPFSYLRYTQIHLENDNKEAVNNYQQLQQEIKNVTGLKKQVLQIFDIIWQKFNGQICDFLIQRGDPRILIHCSTDPIKALQTIHKSQKIKQIIKYIKNSKLNLPKNILHYNGETLTKQNSICHFLYLYLMYCNFFLIKNKKLGAFLQSLLRIIKIIKCSQHIQTKLWVFEMIHLLSERILLNKEVYIQGGQKIKEELQQITKQTLDDLISAIVKSKNFTHKVELKTGLLSIFSKQEKQNSLYDFVKMYPPTIFGLFEPYKRKSKRFNKKQENVADVIAVDQYVEQFLFSQWLNRNQADFMQYLSICSIKTLISIGNNLIVNIYEKDTSKIAVIIKQIVVCLLPVCQDKSDQNMINVELVSEYIFKVLDNNSLRPELLRFIRRNLLDIYMANDFFKCTKKSLFYWKGIVDYCTEGYDLLSQLMSKQGLFDGFLKGKTQVLRLKIKSFQRICFIIYAGKIDKYQNKLRTVLQSLNDVMKQQNPQPALLILMLFCIRILLMRLSQSSLNKMFRSVWPGLITTLIQIFGKEKNSRNINLFLAALKVVQLIQALELQEFHLHKWMFIIDFFGIRIQPQSGKGYQEELKQSDILTPFVFKPYLTKLLPLHMFRCYFMPQFYQYQKQGQKRQIIKRKIIIKQSNIETLQQVQNLSYVLIQYMIDLNQKKVFVDKTDIEDVIQGDFISLDDYIFQVK